MATFSIVLIWIALPSAEIYRWIDENGVTHFSDRKPPESDQRQVETVDPSKTGNLTVVPVENSRIPEISDVKDQFVNEDKTELNKNLHIVIYTTDW